MGNKRVRVNDSYEIIKGIEKRGYTSSDKNGGFSNLCGNNSNDIKTPPKDYGSKTTQSK